MKALQLAHLFICLFRPYFRREMERDINVTAEKTEQSSSLRKNINEDTCVVNCRTSSERSCGTADIVAKARWTLLRQVSLPSKGGIICENFPYLIISHLIEPYSHIFRAVRVIETKCCNHGRCFSFISLSFLPFFRYKILL